MNVVFVYYLFIMCVLCARIMHEVCVRYASVVCICYVYVLSG